METCLNCGHGAASHASGLCWANERHGVYCQCPGLRIADPLADALEEAFREPK